MTTGEHQDPKTLKESRTGTDTLARQCFYLRSIRAKEFISSSSKARVLRLQKKKKKKKKKERQGCSYLGRIVHGMCEWSMHVCGSSII